MSRIFVECIMAAELVLSLVLKHIAPDSVTLADVQVDILFSASLIIWAINHKRDDE